MGFWRLLPAGATVAVPTMMQVGPDDAVLNLCKWPRKLFPSLAENCLPGVSETDLYVAVTLISCGSILWFGWPYLKEATRRARMISGIIILCCGVVISIFGLSIIAAGDVPKGIIASTDKPQPTLTDSQAMPIVRFSPTPSVVAALPQAQPPAEEDPIRALDVVLMPAPGQLRLTNNERVDISLWGTKTEGHPADMVSEARLIPPGHFFYISTDIFEIIAKNDIGANGWKSYSAEYYLSSKGERFVARFKIVAQIAAGAVSFHTSQLGVRKEDWKQNAKK